jgi:hypothetical protein
MNRTRIMRQGVPRRTILAGTMLALGAAVVSEAPAGQKLAQADANYQSTPKGGQRCGICYNFQQPNGCKFVQGNISPDGWCQLFAPKA